MLSTISTIGREINDADGHSTCCTTPPFFSSAATPPPTIVPSSDPVLPLRILALTLSPPPCSRSAAIARGRSAGQCKNTWSGSIVNKSSHSSSVNFAVSG